MTAQRFRFRLERVARLREVTEREALAEMGRERQRAAEAEALAAAARNAASAALDQLSEAPDPGARITGDRVAERLAEYARTQRELAEGARQDAERAAAAWRERRMEFKAVERLRERAFERFVAEMETADERERDEVAMQRRVRAEAEDEAHGSPGQGTGPRARHPQRKPPPTRDFVPGVPQDGR